MVERNIGADEGAEMEATQRSLEWMTNVGPV